MCSCERVSNISRLPSSLEIILLLSHFQRVLFSMRSVERENIIFSILGTENPTWWANQKRELGDVK